MSVVTEFFGRPPQEPPPATRTQAVHDGSPTLAASLRQFRTGWPYFPQLRQFEMTVGDLLEVLKRLPSCAETNMMKEAIPRPQPVYNEAHEARQKRKAA